MPEKSSAFRAHRATMVAFSLLVGVGASLTPVCAAKAADAREVRLVNSTHTAMVALQLKEFRADAWQADLLNHKPLGINKEIVLPLPENSPCFYDIKAMFEDGHRVMKKHVDLCKSPVFKLTDF